MRVRPLVVDDSVRAQVAEVIAYAKEHVMDSQRLMNLSAIKDPRLAVGNNPLTRVQFQFGYRVIYNRERQPVHGLCHHISISVDEEVTPKPPEKILPSEAAVEMILSVFGMSPLNKSLYIWIEPIQDGGGGAINIIEKVKEGE